MSGPGPAHRRELTAAVLGTLGAGGLALVAGGQTWARVVTERPAPLPPVARVVPGAEVAPLVPAAGLLLLAAAVALLAVRGPARTAVGLLVALAGGLVGWSAGRALGGYVPALGTGGGSVATEVDLAAGWPALALAAGVLGVAAGGLVLLRGRAWPGMGRRYERPGPAGNGSPAGHGPEEAQRERSAEERVQDAWRALDRGEDPTESPRAPSS